MAISTGSSARKVLSSTRPVRTFFSLVRTKAPPLPGLTCWNSTTFMSAPSMFSVMPFFRSLVVGIAPPDARRAGLPAQGRRAAYRSQLEELLGGGGEQLVTVRADDSEILDPHAAEAGEVDTGLDGHRRSGGDPTRAARAHPGRLVDLQADAVAARVAEGVAAAGGRDHLAAGLVDLGTAHPGAQRGQSRLLSAPHQLVELPLARRGAAEHHRAGHVGAVALDHRAEVEDDQVAAAQRPLARAVVRLGAVLAEGDDRVERRAVAAVAAHADLELPGDLALGHARVEPAEHLGQRLGADPGGLAHRRQLVVVLDLTQLLDQLGGWHHRPSWQQGAQPLAAAPGEPARLEAEAVPVAAEHPDHPGDQVARGQHHLGAVHLGGLPLVATVGEEHGAVVQQQQGAVAAGEAGQVAHVDPLGDQQPDQVDGGEPGAQGAAAGLGGAGLERPCRSAGLPAAGAVVRFHAYSYSGSVTPRGWGGSGGALFAPPVDRAAPRGWGGPGGRCLPPRWIPARRRPAGRGRSWWGRSRRPPRPPLAPPPGGGASARARARWRGGPRRPGCPPPRPRRARRRRCGPARPG